MARLEVSQQGLLWVTFKFQRRYVYPVVGKGEEEGRQGKKTLPPPAYIISAESI